MFKFKLKHLLITAIFAVSIFGLKQNVCAETMEINESNFPDENLRSQLVSTVAKSLGLYFESDYDTCNEVLSSEVGSYNPNTKKYTINTDKVDYIYVSNLSDTTGLYKFTELTTLSIGTDKDLNIDFNFFTKLERLTISGNFATINLKDLSNLSILSITSNNCTEFIPGDVSKITQLTLENIPLDNVNFSSFTNLVYLCISNNSITSFKFDSIMSNLKEFFIDDSSLLSSIDLSNAVNLMSIGINNCPVTSMDISKCTNANEIYITNTNLSSLDISKNSNLGFLKISETNLPVLDVSKNTKLYELDLSKSKISALEISNNPKLEKLSISEIPITSIDVSNCTKLRKLTLYKTNISSLDISNNIKLRKLDIEKNKKMSKLTSGKNTKLNYLYIKDTPIKKLSTLKFRSLHDLSLKNTKISSLDISKNTKLNFLETHNNKKLSKVTTGKNSELYGITINGSPIKKLSTSGYPNLLDLDVSDTKISSLDLKNNKKLNSLCFSGSKIKKLNLKAQKNLVIEFKNVKEGSTIDLSNYIGTGYKLNTEAKKRYKLSYNSKTGKLKTNKKPTYSADNDLDFPWAVLKKGKKEYTIWIDYK